MANRNRNAFCSFCRKSYLDVGPLVEGPGEVYICSECAELCQSIIAQEKRRRLNSIAANLPSTEAIQESLSRLISGQKAAAKALAVAAHSHYQRFGGDSQEKGTHSGHNHPILFVGKTCSSRLLLARALAHVLDVPFSHGQGQVSAAAPTAPRESPLYNLLHDSDFDLVGAQRGIVFVDGIDHPGARQLLMDLQAGRLDAPLQELRFEVDGILFLCGGVFEGLDESMARRGRHPQQPILADDLIAFGIPADLANRFRTIVRIEPLDEETIVRVVSCASLARISNGAT